MARRPSRLLLVVLASLVALPAVALPWRVNASPAVLIPPEEADAALSDRDRIQSQDRRTARLACSVVPNQTGAIRCTATATRARGPGSSFRWWIDGVFHSEGHSLTEVTFSGLTPTSHKIEVFLNDPDAGDIDSMVSSVPDAVTIDLGAGTGSLTAHLACAWAKVRPGVISCTVSASNVPSDAQLEYEWVVDGRVQPNQSADQLSLTDMPNGDHVIMVRPIDARPGFRNRPSTPDSWSITLTGGRPAEQAGGAAPRGGGPPPGGTTPPATPVMGGGASTARPETTPSTPLTEQQLIDLAGLPQEGNDFRLGLENYVSQMRQLFKEAIGDPSDPTPQQQQAISLAKVAILASAHERVGFGGEPSYPSINAMLPVLLKLGVWGARDPKAFAAMQNLWMILGKLERERRQRETPR